MTTTESTAGSSDEMQDQLTDVQDKVLFLLPIPSALLSIIGSATIIFMTIKIRRRRNFTPYTRLLLGLSVSDIISSITTGMAGFMRPLDGQRAYAFGNDSTCSAIGFFTQLSFQSLLYSVMLQYYFLLTAGFGWSNEELSKWVEPLMHTFAIGYPLITATVGAILDAYAETMLGLGCWVNDFPRGCSDAPGHTGQRCYSALLGWIFGGWLMLFTFSSILVCQIMIWRFVRKFSRAAAAGSKDEKSCWASSATEDVLVSASPSLSGNEPKPPGTEGPKRISVKTKQLQRLRLVSSQAFLFVASFCVCSIWIFLLGIAESIAKTPEEEAKMMVDIYPMLVLSSTFTPLQGFLNLIVYMRPKWIRFRTEYPEEANYWIAKRIIFGGSIVPSNAGGRQVGTPINEQRSGSDTSAPNQPRMGPTNESDESPPAATLPQTNEGDTPTTASTSKDKKTCTTANPLCQIRMSSLSSSSQGSAEAGPDSRWEGCGNRQSHSWVPLKAARRCESELPAIANGNIERISEVSDDMTSSHEMSTASVACDADYQVDRKTPESRWDGSQRSHELSIPQRRVSETGIGCMLHISLTDSES